MRTIDNTSLKKASMVLFFIFLSSPVIFAQKIPLPSTWDINVNGYTGIMQLNSMDPVTHALNGTILNSQIQGHIVDRHVQIYRVGTEQMYEAWVLDPSLGAHGQSYYDGALFMTGTVSEANGPIDGVYPFYAKLISGNAVYINFSPGDVYHITQVYKGQQFPRDIVITSVGQNSFVANSNNGTSIWKGFITGNNMRLEHDCNVSAGEPCYQVLNGSWTRGKWKGNWIFTDHPKGRGDWWSDTGTFEFYKK